MTMTSVSVIMTVVVLNFHWRSPEKYSVPVWIQEMVLHRLAYLVCVDTDFNIRSNKRKQTFCATASSRRSRQTQTPEANSILSAADVSLPLKTRITYNHATLDKNIDETTVSSSQPQYLRSSSLLRRQLYAASNNTASYGTYSFPECDGENHAPRRKRPGESPRGPRSRSKDRLQEEVIRALGLLIARQELDENITNIRKQWRQVAQVADRCLFWLFCLGTVLSTFILLVIIPIVGDTGIMDPVENHI